MATGQGYDHTTVCLLDYPYPKEHLYLIATEVSEKQALDADPREIQQINFTGNLDQHANTKIFLVIEEAKETILDFSQEIVRAL